MIVQVGGQRVSVQVQSSGVGRASASARAAAASEAAVQAIFDVAGEVQSGASVTYLSSGTGAIARSMQTRLRDSLCVLDFGVTGDGTTDDAAAIRVAMAAAAGRSLYFPNPPGGFYLCNSSLGTLAASTTLHGESKRSTRIRANFNSGSLLTMADGSALERLYLDGNSKTCKGVEILGSAGNQHMDNVRIISFASDCLYFEKNAGAGFNALNLEAYRSDGTSGSGNYAIVIEDASGGLGPKHFFGLETGGNCAFSFGGGNNVFVIGSTLADCAFSANSSSIHILASRIANATTMSVLGSGINIVGCDVYPLTTLGSGAVSCSMGPGIWNLGVVDSSGSAQNQIFEGVTKSYTPTVSTSVGSITVGDGSVSGTYQRTGTSVNFNANFVVGSTTSFSGGGGTFRITLPITPLSIAVQVNATIFLTDVSAPAFYVGTGIIEDGVAYVYFVREGGAVTTGAPFTFATGDTIAVSGTYTI